MDDAVDDTGSGIYVIGTSKVVEGGLYIQLYSFTFNIDKRNYWEILTSGEFTDGSQSVHSPVSLPLQSF